MAFTLEVLELFSLGELYDTVFRAAEGFVRPAIGRFDVDRSGATVWYN
jgi:hypothetical protein